MSVDFTSDEKQYRATDIMRKTDVVRATEITRGNLPKRENTQIIGSFAEGKNGAYKILEAMTYAGEADIFLCSLNDEKYVLKLYNIGLVFDETKRKKFISFLYNQSHKNIVPLLDYGTFQGQTFDIYPFYKNGDIAKKKLTPKFITDVVVPQVNNALFFIHQNEIIHRDIKPQNIFLGDDENTVLIGDFGIMSIATKSGDRMTRTSSKTTGFAAIELYTNIPNFKSDYYAFGITILYLLRNEDIFENKTDQQILYITNNNEIPTLNKEKYYNLTSSFLSEEERLEGLVCGLTIAHFENRWGYKEVVKWNNRETNSPGAPLQNSAISSEFSKPFPWNKKQYSGLETMARALALDWEKSKIAFHRETITEWLKRERPDICSSILDITEADVFRNEESSDAAFFKILYTINPKEQSFFWKGNEYNTLSDFAEFLLQNEFDDSFAALLKNKILSWWVKNGEEVIYASEELFERICEIEEGSIYSTKDGYYRFILSFLPQNTARVFKFDNIEFNNAEQLISYVIDNKNCLDSVCNKIVFSDNFSAFMWYWGYGNIVKKAALNFADSETSTKKLLSVFELIHRKEEIRDLAVMYSKYSYIYWLQQHLDDYEYLDSKAIDIRYQIESELISNLFSVAQIYDKFATLKEAYHKFYKNTFNDLYILQYKMVENPLNSGIIPKNLNSFFTDEVENNAVPLGYYKSMGGIDFKKQFEKDKESAANLFDSKRNLSLLLSGKAAQANELCKKEILNSILSFILFGTIIAVAIPSFMLLKIPFMFYLSLVALLILPLVEAIFQLVRIVRMISNMLSYKGVFKLEKRISKIKDHLQSSDFKIKNALETGEDFVIDYQNVTMNFKLCGMNRYVNIAYNEGEAKTIDNKFLFWVSGLGTICVISLAIESFKDYFPNIKALFIVPDFPISCFVIFILYTLAFSIISRRKISYTAFTWLITLAATAGAAALILFILNFFV